MKQKMESIPPILESRRWGSQRVRRQPIEEPRAKLRLTDECLYSSFRALALAPGASHHNHARLCEVQNHLVLDGTTEICSGEDVGTPGAGRHCHGEWKRRESKWLSDLSPPRSTPAFPRTRLVRRRDVAAKPDIKCSLQTHTRHVSAE